MNICGTLFCVENKKKEKNYKKIETYPSTNSVHIFNGQNKNAIGFIKDLWQNDNQLPLTNAVLDTR